MKKNLLLLVTSLTFLALSACGDDKPEGDLFRQEGQFYSEKPVPQRTPQSESKSFVNNLNQSPRSPSKFKLDEEAGSGRNRESSVIDNMDEDTDSREWPEDKVSNSLSEGSSGQEDMAIQAPKPVQPKHQPNMGDIPPKTRLREDKDLEDVPPADESDEVQAPSADGNSGSEETAP